MFPEGYTRTLWEGWQCPSLQSSLQGPAGERSLRDLKCPSDTPRRWLLPSLRVAPPQPEGGSSAPTSLSGTRVPLAGVVTLVCSVSADGRTVPGTVPWAIHHELPADSSCALSHICYLNFFHLGLVLYPSDPHSASKLYTGSPEAHHTDVRVSE